MVVVKKAWKISLIYLLMLITLICVLQFHVILSFITIWTNTVTYNHGYFIFPASLWLIYLKKDVLKNIIPVANLYALIPLAIAVFTSIIGYATSVNILQHLAFILMIWSSIWLILGTNFIKNIKFPLFFMLFAIPFGDFLTQPLQNLTADISVKLLHLSGVNAIMQGIHIQTSNSLFIVAEACAGLRFLIANIVIGFLFAYLHFQKILKWCVFIAICCLIPIIGNIFRAYGIMMIAHYTDNEYGAGVDHLIYGWGFFAVLMLINLYIGHKMADDPIQNLNSTIQKQEDYSKKQTIFAYIFAIFFILFIPFNQYIIQKNIEFALMAKLPQKNDLLLFKKLQKLPSTLAVKNQHDWQPSFYGEDAHYKDFKKIGNLILRFDIAYYKAQREEHEVIHYKNRFSDEDWWLLLEKKVVHLKLFMDKMSQTFIMERIGTLNGEQKIILYWYEIGHYRTISSRQAKLYQLLSTFGLNKQSASINSITIDVGKHNIKSIYQMLEKPKP